MALLPRVLCCHLLAILIVGVDGEEAHFSLVFDAGSSGTRLHVYKFYTVHDHTPVFDMTGPWNMKQSPGVSELAQEGKFIEVKERLQLMLKEASKIVPKHLRPASHVQYFGTAGLRSLSQEVLDSTLSTVRDVLDSSEYMFKHDWARMISGTEEGGFSWVAINYEMGNFQSNVEVERETVGVLEMGGGSAQVVFELGDSQDAVEDDLFVFVSRLGRKYRLYSHSYMNYGQNYAIGRMTGNSTKFCRESENRKDEELDTCITAITDEALVKIDAPGKYDHEVAPTRGLFAAAGSFYQTQDTAALNLAGREMNIDDFGQRARQACKTSNNACAAYKPDSCCFALMYQASVLKAWNFNSAAKMKFVKVTSWSLGAAIVTAEVRYQKIGQSGLKLWQALVIGCVLSGLFSAVVSAFITRWCVRTRRDRESELESEDAEIYEMRAALAGGLDTGFGLKPDQGTDVYETV